MRPVQMAWERDYTCSSRKKVFSYKQELLTIEFIHFSFLAVSVLLK